MARQFITNETVNVISPAKYALEHLITKIVGCASILIVLWWPEWDIGKPGFRVGKEIHQHCVLRLLRTAQDFLSEARIMAARH
jgi:hypothetical protein